MFVNLLLLHNLKQISSKKTYKTHLALRQIRKYRMLLKILMSAKRSNLNQEFCEPQEKTFTEDTEVKWSVK